MAYVYKCRTVVNEAWLGARTPYRCFLPCHMLKFFKEGCKRPMIASVYLDVTCLAILSLK